MNLIYQSHPHQSLTLKILISHMKCNSSCLSLFLLSRTIFFSHWFWGYFMRPLLTKESCDFDQRWIVNIRTTFTTSPILSEIFAAIIRKRIICLMVVTGCTHMTLLTRRSLIWILNPWNSHSDVKCIILLVITVFLPRLGFLWLVLG